MMRRTILLADDSPTIRRLVKQTFAESDFDVFEFSNGETAIKALDEMRPSVVLADIYMPGKNGYQVCSFVRNHPALVNTPVVLLVGAFDAFDEESAKQAGATANITKPFEPGALIDLVTSILLPETKAVLVVPAAAPAPAEVRSSEPLPVETGVQPDSEDLLGLETIFKDRTETASTEAITEADVERIADRVIQKLSTQVIESIAWDIVPDITEKIVRQELKRINES